MHSHPNGPAEFWAQVDRSGDCWLWIGSKTPAGYGRFYHDRTSDRAHRYAYGLLIGPPGESLDHKCHNADPACPGGRACRHRLCVNPAHLDDVPIEVNKRRALIRRLKGVAHCKRGHAWNAENTYIEPGTGRRKCRACWRVTARSRYAQRRAA